MFKEVQPFSVGERTGSFDPAVWTGSFDLTVFPTPPGGGPVLVRRIGFRFWGDGFDPAVWGGCLGWMF